MSDIPLEQYLESRIISLQNELTKSERELNSRLEGMNHLQAKMDNLQHLMASREYVETLKESMGFRIGKLETRAAYGLGYITGVSAAVSITVSVLLPLLKAL